MIYLRKLTFYKNQLLTFLMSIKGQVCDIAEKRNYANDMKYLLIISLLILTNFVQAKTIVFIGDSLTEGYGIDKNKSYPALIEKKLVADGHQNLKIINGSVSGSTSASGLSRLKWFKKAKPDIVVLALGANDGLRGIRAEVTFKNLEKVIKLANESEIKLLLVGLRMPPNYGKEYTEEFANVFSRLAKKYKLPFVPQLLKGVAGEASLNQEDGIHPNEKGSLKMMENVYPVLKELL
jgi:acyl-CoA thioesterase-1